VSRESAEEVRSTAGPKAAKVLRLLEEASAAMARERWSDAQRLAGQAKGLAARSGAVREALGLALYRAGKFHEALRELQAYRRITGRPDQNHLIADAHRAGGSPEKAVPLAQEALRAQRIPDEVRAEAAVVGGAALADMGRFEEALALLRRFDRAPDVARPHDLRVWYVTGDVLARAGRSDEARDVFQRILRHDADAYDVAERLAALS
jgi:tetratricopeptide (TPR) repeat protein